jgi:ribonuclease HI
MTPSPRKPTASDNSGRIKGAADYIIVFDGGSRGNPGFGYGSYMIERARDGKQDLKRLEFGDGKTNNEAEYGALMAALQDLVGRIEAAGRDPHTFSIRIRGDSALVINQLNGQWKTRSPRMAALCVEAKGLLRRFRAWEILHQPREESVRVLGH